MCSLLTRKHSNSTLKHPKIQLIVCLPTLYYLFTITHILFQTCKNIYNCHSAVMAQFTFCTGCVLDGHRAIASVLGIRIRRLAFHVPISPSLAAPCKPCKVSHNKPIKNVFPSYPTRTPAHNNVLMLYAYMLLSYTLASLYISTHTHVSH